VSWSGGSGVKPLQAGQACGCGPTLNGHFSHGAPLTRISHPRRLTRIKEGNKVNGRYKLREGALILCGYDAGYYDDQSLSLRRNAHDALTHQNMGRIID